MKKNYENDDQINVINICSNQFLSLKEKYYQKGKIGKKYSLFENMKYDTYHFTIVNTAVSILSRDFRRKRNFNSLV